MLQRPLEWKLNFLPISGINMSLLEIFLRVLGKILQVFYFFWSCAHLFSYIVSGLFWLWLWRGPSNSILQDFSILQLLFSGGYTIREGSHSFYSLRWPGRGAGDMAGGSELHCCFDCAFAWSLLKIYLPIYIFEKNACIGCSFSSTVCHLRGVIFKINSE